MDYLYTKNHNNCLQYVGTLEYLINVLHKLIFFWKFPTCTALLPPARLLIFEIFPACMFITSCTFIRYSRAEVSIKRTHSIKRTVCLDFQKSLLNVPYNLTLMKFLTKRTVSIKRTVCKNFQITLLKVEYDLKIKMIIN